MFGFCDARDWFPPKRHEWIYVVVDGRLAVRCLHCLKTTSGWKP